MPLSDYQEKRTLDNVFGAVAATPAATYYISLHTANSGQAGASEVASANAYARVAVANNTTNFPNSTGSPASKSNGAAVAFPTPTGSWGTATYFGIWDATSAGNFVAGGVLTTPQAIGLNNTVSFAAGALVFTLT
jgi:hypothetical protein